MNYTKQLSNITHIDPILACKASHRSSMLTKSWQLNSSLICYELIHIRRKLHLNSGHMVQFFLTNDSFVVVPINRSVKDLRGILPKPTKSLTIEEMDEIIKGSYDRN